MGDTVITVSVSGSAGPMSFNSLSGQLVDELGLEVVHEPNCCAPCRANEDPTLVPFPGCNGNIGAKIAAGEAGEKSGPDPDDVGEIAIGNLCRCTVRVVHVHGEAAL